MTHPLHEELQSLQLGEDRVGYVQTFKGSAQISYEIDSLQISKGT